MDTNTARRLLTEERERLEGVRGSSTDDGGAFLEPEVISTSELSGVDQHPADVGTELFERERDLAIMERVDAELAEVDHAFSKLDQGTYGVCEACGRTIPDPRLEALPATRFCIDDQALAEREARAVVPDEPDDTPTRADDTTDAAVTGTSAHGDVDFGVPDSADDDPDDAGPVDSSTADATGVAPDGVDITGVLANPDDR